MSAPGHRKATRAAVMAARSLAADIAKRRGHLPDMDDAGLDGFAAGIRSLCALLERDPPATVRAAKDMVLDADAPWIAGNALVTLLNQAAQAQRVDPYTA